MTRFSILIVAIVMAVMPLSAQKNPDLRWLPKQTPQRAEMILPQVKGYNIYKADLHTHSAFSDGSVLPEYRVKEAWIDGLDVGAGGDFWNDATVFGMDIDLGIHDIRKHAVAIFDNRGSGFVA